MLDVTDNLVSRICVPPERVDTTAMTHLVVAADRAPPRSQTRQTIALRRGFWLGDAFASGSSATMTTRRWHHGPRGLSRSVPPRRWAPTSATDFTVVGIGDMSETCSAGCSCRSTSAGGGVRSPAFLDPDPIRCQLRSANGCSTCPGRGRTTTRADLRRRRGVASLGEIGPHRAAGPRGARARDGDGRLPDQLIRRFRRAGRPALERRHRYYVKALNQSHASRRPVQRRGEDRHLLRAGWSARAAAPG
jgi:hypothetical protein